MKDSSEARSCATAGGVAAQGRAQRSAGKAIPLCRESKYDGGKQCLQYQDRKQ